MNDIKFTYPAFYSTDGETIVIEVPDLKIKPFTVSEKDRSKIADITWDKAAQTVGAMLQAGKTPPPSRTLEDLEISEDEDRDAFLVELILA